MLLLDKTLLKLTKGLWKWIISIAAVRMAALAAATAFASLMAGALGSFFQTGTQNVNLSSAILYALMAAGVSLVCQLVQAELEYRCTAQARSDLRRKIFYKTMELDAGNIEAIGPVSAITASVDAVENIQTYYSQYLPSLLFSFMAPVFLFFRMKKISLLIAVLLLSVSLILLPVHNIFRYHIEKLRRVYWQTLDDMTGWYLDGIRGMNTLKLFDQTEIHAEKLSDKADQLNKNINRFMKVNFTSFLATEGLIYASIAVILTLCAIRLKSGEMALGDALMVLLLSYSWFSSVRQLMTATHSALTAVSAADKVAQILDVNTERQYNPDLLEDPDHFAGIRMRHVSFSYEGRDAALNDVCLDVKKGSVTALAGLSGCGKSTAASLMMRFSDPGSGAVYLEGKNYCSLKPEEIRKKVIMVPQTVSLFKGSIRDNLLLADETADDEKLMAALKNVRLDEFVSSLQDGLDSDVGEAGSRLSGGQKQKIGIARALLSEAEYIILDEASSAVDAKSEEEIRRCIASLSKTKTLVVISHRLSSIRNADCIYILEGGKISESGTHEQLMGNHGLYRRLVEEQESLQEAAV